MPRIRADSTNGWSSERSNSVRTLCAMNPASGIASVSAGSTIPFGDEPLMIGNQRSPSPKTSSRMMPSQ